MEEENKELINRIKRALEVLELANHPSGRSLPAYLLGIIDDAKNILKENLNK